MNDITRSDWLCCAYLRKSREDEERERYGTGETLERHRRIIESMAERNGHEVRRWYTEVVSGETIAEREQMRLLLSDVASNRWDAVYVVEASRLGRGGGSDQEKIINAFRYTNTRVVTEFKIYEPTDEWDMRQLKNELRNSEDELISILTRLSRGRRRAAEDGIWQATSMTPYGWRAVRIKGRWQLEPDDHHETMLRIYDLLEAGETYRSIAEAFNAEMIPTARGAAEWSAQAVKAIAENVANCGFVIYNQGVTVRVFDPETYEVHKKREHNPKPIIAVGLHNGNGTISQERFERLTRKQVHAPRMKKGHTLRDPLSGLLKCGKCGYSMTRNINWRSGDRSKKVTYYYHSYHNHGPAGNCEGCRAVRADRVIEALVDSLSQLANDIELEPKSNEAEMLRKRIDGLRDAVKREERAKRRAMEAYEAEIYTIEELRERRAKANAKIEELNRRIAEAKPKEYAPDAPVKLRRCIGLLLDEDVPAKEKNDFLKTIIERIDYYNDTPKRAQPNVFRLEITLRDYS